MVPAVLVDGLSRQWRQPLSRRGLKGPAAERKLNTRTNAVTPKKLTKASRNPSRPAPVAAESQN